MCKTVSDSYNSTCAWIHLRVSLGKKHKYVAHHSKIQPFKGQTFSQRLFLPTFLRTILILMPMFLRSSAVFLPEKCKSFLVGKTSIGKTPLHVETNSSLYFGQYLVLGRGWLLFQPAHFVMESSSFGFCFFKELWRSDQASATRPHCVFPLEKPSFTAVS